MQHLWKACTYSSCMVYVLCFPLVIPPIICAILMVCMPESPVLLIAQEKYEEAKLALKFYRGENFDLSEDIRDIQEYLNCEEGSSLPNNKSTANLIGCLTLTIYCVFTMIAGVMPVLIYEDVLFQTGVVYSMNKTTCYIVGLLMVIVGTIIATYLIDTYGRRILLIISLGIMSCTIAVLGTYFLVLAYHELAAKKVEYVVVWVLYLYMLAYGLGAGPITWCFVGEVPSPGAKNFILAVAFSAFWMTGYIIMRVHALVEDRIGEGGALLIISGITLTGFVLAFFFVTETKKMTLYEIQVLLRQGYVAV